MAQRNKEIGPFLCAINGVGVFDMPTAKAKAAVPKADPPVIKFPHTPPCEHHATSTKLIYNWPPKDTLKTTIKSY